VARRVGRGADQGAGKDADRDVAGLATKSVVDGRHRSLVAAGCRRNSCGNPVIAARPQNQIRTDRHAMQAMPSADLSADPIAARATPLRVPARPVSVRLANVSLARAMPRVNAANPVRVVATRATAIRRAMTRCSPPRMKALCTKRRWVTDKATASHSAKVCSAKLPHCSRVVRAATKGRRANRSLRS